MIKRIKTNDFLVLLKWCYSVLNLQTRRRKRLPCIQCFLLQPKKCNTEAHIIAVNGQKWSKDDKHFSNLFIMLLSFMLQMFAKKKEINRKILITDINI